MRNCRRGGREEGNSSCCLGRDMRRSGSGAAKAESLLERTHGVHELHAADGRAKALSESAAAGFRSTQVKGSSSSFLLSSDSLERVKTELREDVSGHSSLSDIESDSDSPTEVNAGAAPAGGRGASLTCPPCRTKPRRRPPGRTRTVLRRRRGPRLSRKAQGTPSSWTSAARSSGTSKSHSNGEHQHPSKFAV